MFDPSLGTKTMIIACPGCQTRFRIAEAALSGRGPAGRRVRCANCGHLWHYRIDPPPLLGSASDRLTTGTSPAPILLVRPKPEDAGFMSASEILAIEALGVETSRPRIDLSVGPLRADPALAPSTAEPRFTATPRPAPRALPPASAAANRQRHWGRVGAAGAASLVAATAVAGYFARDAIMSVWPPATSLYAAIDLAGPADAGLEVTLMPTRAGDQLVVEGDIVNAAAVVHRIPRLKITLRDRNSTVLASRELEPPVIALPPGASAHFNTVFAHPSVAAKDVAVSFATD
jgi:predicted Zn finger-like uncharacterized protein